MNGSYQNFVYSPSLTLSYINDHDKKIKLLYATCTLDICYLKLRSYAWLTLGDKEKS